MAYTLRNFYKSREWERLLDVIKAERLTEEGELLCAHCGKPIVTPAPADTFPDVFHIHHQVSRLHNAFDPCGFAAQRRTIDKINEGIKVNGGDT